MKIIRWCIVLILLLGGSLWLIEEGSVERDQNEISNKNMESIQEEISIEKETIKEDPIEIYMEGMSLEEKIGQLFIAALNGEMGNEILLKQYQVGGIVLFKKDIQGKQQVQELIDSLQKVSKIPLWIAIDEEGGRVSRIGHISDITKEPFKAAYEIGQTEDTHKAYEEAKKMGKILYDLGINMDFAPVADIYNNESNTVIGNRSFGHTKEEVTPMVIAFAKGIIRWCIVLILLLGGSLWLIEEGSVERDQNEISNKNMESIQEEISIEKETIKEDPIEIYMEGMSLEEKIGQLFIAALNGEMGNEILLKQYQVGGIVLFKKDIQGKQQVQELIDSLQKVSKIPLWIAIDEEGGRVSRIGHISDITKEPFKAAYEIGQTEDTHKAYEEAKKMGKILYDLGINMDFAPVADIYNNESNTVIGNRSFGHTKEEVTPMVIAFAKGLKEEGIFPVVKHFPGHGNTYQDSHEQLAYIDKTLQDLEEEELVPFFEATRNGIEGMMVGHLVVSEVDQFPATLSPKWGSYIKEHFDTEELLLITDAMNMGAVVQSKEAGNAAVESFLSGMDIILMPDDLGAAKEAMKKAYEEGRITKDRLDKSVRKILLKKVEQNLLVLE